jgi:nucleotide-binding universal stress UspA family protein
MFNVVVVGADESPTARRAVEAASEIAVMSGGQLHIVTAYQPAARHEKMLPDEFKYLSSDSEVLAVLQVLSFIPKKHGVEAQLHSVEGDPAEAIINKAAQLDADLIVVGNRGMHGVRRVLGSVPNSVAHGAPCSVIIVDTTE